jgi:hypothetical protein
VGLVVEVRLASTERATAFGLIPLVGFGLGIKGSNAAVLATATATCPNDDTGEQYERCS